MAGRCFLVEAAVYDPRPPATPPCHLLPPLALGADLPGAAFPEGFDGLAFRLI